jgi:hypothetical protein
LYEEVNDVLYVFHAATEQFSRSTYPTFNLFYPHIVNIMKTLGQLKQSTKPNLRTMADAMFDKFDKYWGQNATLCLLWLQFLILDLRWV